jgi:hypothetical protein
MDNSGEAREALRPDRIPIEIIFFAAAAASAPRPIVTDLTVHACNCLAASRWTSADRPLARSFLCVIDRIRRSRGIRVLISSFPSA